MGALALKTDERVRDIRIDEYVIAVDLMDGRRISVPLIWYTKLANANQKARENWETSGGGYGIHWPDIDEDLSTEGLLRGAPAPMPLANFHSSRT